MKKKLREKFIGSREDQQKAGLTEDVNCPICNIIFSTRANLLVHSLNFHSNLPDPNESAASTLKESEAMGLESSITKLHSERRGFTKELQTEKN